MTRGAQPPVSRRLAWLLLFALLTLQLLGLMHSVVHAPQAHAAHTLVNAAPSGAQNGNGSWLAWLFSSHQDDADCHLFDQASHGYASPTLAALVLSGVLPSMWVLIFESEALARWAAFFEARGPPDLLH